MKILSLFDGISCARVACEKAGIPVEIYYASEIDKYAVQIAKKNYPEILQLGSVSEIGYTDGQFCQKAGALYNTMGVDFMEDIDLMIGGSPCQDLSIAKANRKGLDGDRSGLFWEYLRILKEVKPKYFILENVASMPKEAKEIITKELGVEPIMIDAQLVSAQRRKRLFWTNIPNVTLPKDREIFLKDILQSESEVDEKYYINEATLKTILDKIFNGKPLAQAFRVHSIDGKSVTLSSGGGGTGAKTGLYVMNPNGTEKLKSNTIRTSGRGSGFGDKHNWDEICILQRSRGNNTGGLKYDKTPTLTSNSWQDNNHLVFRGRVRKLTPIECERLQSIPDGHTEGLSDAQRYKVLGNAFNADVIAHILSFIPKK